MTADGLIAGGTQTSYVLALQFDAYGAIGAWMYAVIGGIDTDPDQPGYKRIIMRPRPGGGLTRAQAELLSVYGPIRSAWTLDNGRFDWRITVPANTSATVYVPAAAGVSIREGDTPAAAAEGVRWLGHEADAAVYEVTAGEYHFTSSEPQPVADR